MTRRDDVPERPVVNLSTPEQREAFREAEIAARQELDESNPTVGRVLREVAEAYAGYRVEQPADVLEDEEVPA